MTVQSDCDDESAPQAIAEPKWAAAIEEKIQHFSPTAQAAVRKYWGSVVMRTQRAFSEENGLDNMQKKESPTDYLAAPVEVCKSLTTEPRSNYAEAELHIYESQDDLLSAMDFPEQHSNAKAWKSLRKVESLEREIMMQTSLDSLINEPTADADALSSAHKELHVIESDGEEERRRGSLEELDKNWKSFAGLDQQKTWRSVDAAGPCADSRYHQNNYKRFQNNTASLINSPGQMERLKRNLRKAKSVIEEKRAKREEQRSIQVFQCKHLQKLQLKAERSLQEDVLREEEEEERMEESLSHIPLDTFKELNGSIFRTISEIVVSFQDEDRTTEEELTEGKEILFQQLASAAERGTRDSCEVFSEHVCSALEETVIFKPLTPNTEDSVYQQTFSETVSLAVEKDTVGIHDIILKEWSFPIENVSTVSQNSQQYFPMEESFAEKRYAALASVPTMDSRDLTRRTSVVMEEHTVESLDMLLVQLAASVGWDEVDNAMSSSQRGNDQEICLPGTVICTPEDVPLESEEKFTAEIHSSAVVWPLELQMYIQSDCNESIDEMESIESGIESESNGCEWEMLVQEYLHQLLQDLSEVLSTTTATYQRRRPLCDQPKRRKLSSHRRLLSPMPSRMPPPSPSAALQEPYVGIGDGLGRAGGPASAGDLSPIGGGIAGAVRICNCCPYGYHIDLDFVRYCEALANAKPSAEELQRRDRRRSRKSMEFMLGLESWFDQWDAGERVQAVPEAAHESEPDSPPQQHRPLTATDCNYGAATPSSTTLHQRQRSSSVPRFTYGLLPAATSAALSPASRHHRADSPFGTASSTSSSLRGGVESDRGESPYLYSLRRQQQQQRAPAVSPPEQRAFLRDALDEVCSEFERTVERTSVRRRRTDSYNHNRPLIYGGVIERRHSDRNNNDTDKLHNGHGANRQRDRFPGSASETDSCVAGNKSPRTSPRVSRSFTRSHTLPFQRKPSPAEQQYESYVQARVVENAKSPVEDAATRAAATATTHTQTPLATPPPPPPPRRNAAKLLSPSFSSSTRSESSLDGAGGVGDLGGGGTVLTPSTLLSPDSAGDSGSANSGAAAEAQTLYQIREQMALSLKRMRDLEDQVKNIPDLQEELQRLRDEKQQLADTLQCREEELQQQRVRENDRERDRERDLSLVHSSSPSPVASAKFTPQRISPVSLESLNVRLLSSASSTTSTTTTTMFTTTGTAISGATPTPSPTLGDRQQQPVRSVLKRDVATMSVRGPATRDVAVGSPLITLRTVGTNPLQSLSIAEVLYTRLEMDEHIHMAVRSYEEQRDVERPKQLITVGTQMYKSAEGTRESGMQTTPERPVLRYAVGVLAKPTTRESYVMCKPDMRSIATSEDRVDDRLCEKCASSRRSVACDTTGLPTAAEVDGGRQTRAIAALAQPISLKLLEATGRSATFSLGEHERLSGIRKSTGTQCTPEAPAPGHSIASQTVAELPQPKHSVGVQQQPIQHCVSTQASTANTHRQTDTADLIRLCATQTSTEEICPPAPPPTTLATPTTRSTGSNTEAPRVKLVAVGVNTPAPSAVRHSASNTDQVRKRDIAVGDVVKPHISIACADNYCDSCKDAIQNLAKDFSKVLAVAETSTQLPLPRSTSGSTFPFGGGGNGNGQSSLPGLTDSRIPRPKHLTSPSPVRKPFQRQNTYTITPSPTPSPVADKRTMSSSLHEQPPLIVNLGQLDVNIRETESIISTSVARSSSDDKVVPGTTGGVRGRRPPVSPQKKPIAHSNANEQEDTAKLTEMPPIKIRELDDKELPSSPENYEVTHAGAGDLIVREQKRVSISWSRDASPAPHKSLENSFTDKLRESMESNASGTDMGQGARKRTVTPSPSPPKSSQPSDDLDVFNSGTVEKSQRPPSKTLLQKLAMVDAAPRTKFAPTKEMMAALKIINESLLKKLGAKAFSSSSLKTAKQTIQQEWYRVSSTEKANPHEVEDYLGSFETMSVPLLEYCVNLFDNNGNTGMHYAVSHGNFDVVSILLDSKVCNVNQMNNAGYTSVMLVSLAKLKNPAHRTVVERLFQMADVNIRAKKHCQTALMLAVSHGNSDMVEMLLAAGADINIQDEDGSTALMGAAEHGRMEIVKHLLSQANCDSLIQDMDGSTAFKIAWQAGHRDIALLLYVHEQMLRGKMPNRGGNSPRTPTQLSPRQHKRNPSE